MKSECKNYATLAVHLSAEIIAKVDALAAKEERSRSYVLGRIIKQELSTAPEPSIRFVRRARTKKAAA